MQPEFTFLPRAAALGAYAVALLVLCTPAFGTPPPVPSQALIPPQGDEGSPGGGRPAPAASPVALEPVGEGGGAPRLTALPARAAPKGGHKRKPASTQGGSKRPRPEAPAPPATPAPEQNPQERLYTCPVCNHESKGVSARRIHMRTHAEENPYACDKCSYIATYSWNMKTHKTTCQGIQKASNPSENKGKISCGSCAFTCVSRSSMYTHRMTHTGVRPHQCTQCGARFINRSNLKKHQKQTSLTGNLWECASCLHKFPTKRTMERHIQQGCQKGLLKPQASSSSAPTGPAAPGGGGGGEAPVSSRFGSGRQREPKAGPVPVLHPDELNP